MTNQVNQLKMEMEDWVLENMKELTDDIYEGVRRRTPVASGRAQRGWVQIDAQKIGEDSTVGNDVEYITYLEDGTADTAPNNMVKATLQEIGDKR